MMNFRQRMGWICMALYLFASMAGLYYVFEINHIYNRLTLERVEQVAQGLPTPADSSSLSWISSVTAHISLLPLWLWAMLILLPYLQMFLFLYSCTRADPRAVGYCILPICLALLCSRHQALAKASNQIGQLQLIDT